MEWIQDPFPHRFGTGFFPEDLYQAMLDSLPTLESRCKFELNDPAWEYKDHSNRTEPLRGRLSYREADPLWKHVFSLIRNKLFNSWFKFVKFMFISFWSWTRNN